MDLPPDTPPAAGSEPAATRRLVRGSTLLLAGRVLSAAVNFLVQVLVVRHLSQSAYGAFAYALSVVGFAHSVVGLGLDRAIARFLPIYDEQGQRDRAAGAIVLALGTALGLGLAFALVLHGGRSLASGVLTIGDDALLLLLVLAFLAPLQAIDDLLVALFAVLSSPRAIFFRRHVLTPGLRILLVLLFIAGRRGPLFLAGGYVVIGLVGVLAYSILLVRLLRRRGWFEGLSRRQLVFPGRELLAFSIPLLTTDIVYGIMHTVDVVLLERFHGSASVATLRAVQPAARLNELVMFSFGTLFTPAAARLFARRDGEGLNELYWRTSTWIAVFTFPVFAVTTSLATPVTLFLYGTRYEGSTPLLALLACGYYINAALGFNGLTLRVYGRVRTVVILNLVTAAVNGMLALVLIPRFGALGAALSTLTALLVHNTLKQVGLGLATDVRAFDLRYARVYIVIAVSGAGLWILQAATGWPPVVALGLAVAASLTTVRLSRRQLRVEETFPELLRLPGARFLLGGNG